MLDEEVRGPMTGIFLDYSDSVTPHDCIDGDCDSVSDVGRDRFYLSEDQAGRLLES